MTPSLDEAISRLVFGPGANIRSFDAWVRERHVGDRSAFERAMELTADEIERLNEGGR